MMNGYESPMSFKVDLKWNKDVTKVAGGVISCKVPYRYDCHEFVTGTYSQWVGAGGKAHTWADMEASVP